MKTFGYCLIFLIITLVSCGPESPEKADEGTEAECGIRVKVVHSFCAFIFLEIQDEQYDHLGDADWKFMDGRNTRPVFMVTNICDFGADLYQNELLDKEFEVKQVNTYEDECAVCYGGYGGALPNKSLVVRLCTATEE
jgi:hypothetical protein